MAIPRDGLMAGQHGGRMPIPLVDLAWQHREIEAELSAGLARVIASSAFVLGPDVAQFESEYAALCGVPHCVGVANGTDALELALRALDVGPGAEVVVPANTFAASALAVARAGAEPVFVDCSEADHLVEADAVAERISPRTRALLVVDLFGQIPDMEALEQCAAEAGVALVEDAAQAQGAARHGRRAGSFGDISGTSFYPGKNLGAYGDAGAVTTRSDALAARVRRLRNYGSDVKYQHPEAGFNSRLDTLQAVVLRAKLARLERWNALRREAAARYDALLAGVEGVARPRVRAGNEHVWHLYVVRVSARDAVLAKLHEAGIAAAIHYPLPVPLQGAFAAQGHRAGDFPNAERAAREMISLPMHPGLAAADQERVVEVLRRAVASTRPGRGG